MPITPPQEIFMKFAISANNRCLFKLGVGAALVVAAGAAMAQAKPLAGQTVKIAMKIGRAHV